MAASLAISYRLGNQSVTGCARSKNRDQLEFPDFYLPFNGHLDSTTLGALPNERTLELTDRTTVKTFLKESRCEI